MNTDLAGLVLVARYGLESLLARGGMADVYRGIDRRLGRQVAVKMPHPHLIDDPAFIERLRREAKAVAALSHPNIVAMYDQGEADGRPFLVMELVEGESVDTLLGRQRPLPTTRAIDIVLDVLAALEHAHSRGIVHRDIKPQNVLLTSGGRAKLADFGIAQTENAETLSVAGELLGSIHYLAPERLSGQSATPAADLYSVGVMLYQMLVGQLPFEGDSTVAVAAQHQQRDPDPPSKRRAGLPVWVDEVVMRALAKDPSERYPSALAMRNDLSQRLAAHNAPTITIRAGSPGGPSFKSLFKMPFTTRKWTLRHMALYSATLVGVILLASIVLLFNLALPPSNAGTPTSVSSLQIIPTPRTTTPPPTSTPVPPTATTVPSALQRLEELKALVQNSMPRGDAGKEERDILVNLDEIKRRITEGQTKEAASLIRELIKDVRDMANKGKIDRNLSETLIARLTELLSYVQ